MRCYRFVVAGLMPIVLLAGCRGGSSPFASKTAAAPAAPTAPVQSMAPPSAVAPPYASVQPYGAVPPNGPVPPYGATPYNAVPYNTIQPVSAQIPQPQGQPPAAPPSTQPEPKKEGGFFKSLSGFLPSGNDDSERKGWDTPKYRGISD